MVKNKTRSQRLLGSCLGVILSATVEITPGGQLGIDTEWERPVNDNWSERWLKIRNPKRGIGPHGIFSTQFDKLVGVILA